MKLYIKNMVCARCEMLIITELKKMELSIISIALGKVEVANNLDESQIKRLAQSLQLLGFELLDNKENRLVERIKNLIIDLVHNKKKLLKSNLSKYLTADLGQDYSTISKLFSEKEGTTIEHYFIAQKIEQTKELLICDEMTLSEIAFQLNYSSTAHLSNQFKKTTGMTPTQFKQLKE
jgi:AraC-like DNA-binding protein